MQMHTNFVRQTSTYGLYPGNSLFVQLFGIFVTFNVIVVCSLTSYSQRDIKTDVIALNYCLSNN